LTEGGPEGNADLSITADNVAYFGEPVYEYDMAQGIEDGYLAACEIVRRDIFLDEKVQREDGSSWSGAPSNGAPPSVAAKKQVLRTWAQNLPLPSSILFSTRPSERLSS
jgi:hypothetical protein